MAAPRLLFVTGKLAEPALRRQAADLAARLGFEFQVAVLPISVVALATVSWIARRLTVPVDVTRVILPGLCLGDLTELESRWHKPFERGPKDLRDLPEYLGAESGKPADYGDYDIEIIAEINHAPRAAPDELIAQSQALRADGADVIDLGCDPGSVWSGLPAAIHSLNAEGLRVSVDTWNPVEIEMALRAGAELVLSVNQTNLKEIVDLARQKVRAEVVVLPDDPTTLDGLDQTIAVLKANEIPFRIDPVLEPIGFGFAGSLLRYGEVRRRYPDAAMLMGVGNLTELTDVDSAGVNVLLLGICQELGIHSVLTTQVINWCRSSVRELDLARRLVHYAVRHKVLPKRLEPDLVLLRDPRLHEHGEERLRELAESLKDRNFRIFAERGMIHVLNGLQTLTGRDPFELFDQISRTESITPSHAFYLGYEMAKASIALALGKEYVQDQALRWGFLTVPEKSHHGKLTKEQNPDSGNDPGESY